MSTEKRFYPEAQMEVKEALLSFLYDMERKPMDTSCYSPEDVVIQYNQDALNDAIIVIMDAFGFDAKI